jgi:hypothetical protein
MEAPSGDPTMGLPHGAFTQFRERMMLVED